jgi:chorismate-pyruvate lyase
MSDRDEKCELIHALSERILRADSATEELEQWCRERAISDGRIIALCTGHSTPELLDDESLEALYPYDTSGKTKFRRVKLATSGIVVVEALNWYFPGNLTQAICDQLETTEIPFGRAIQALNPKRRTFLVRRCTPEQLVDAQGSINPAATAFEHHAVVYSADNTPLAVVHERFRVLLVCRVPEFSNIYTQVFLGLRSESGAGSARATFPRQRGDHDVITNGMAR